MTDGPTRGAASATPRASVSVIVPTYKEAANLPLLIDRVARLRQTSGLEIELLIMTTAATARSTW